MKKVLIALLTLSALWISSCGDKDSASEEEKNPLFATWQIVEVTNDFGLMDVGKYFIFNEKGYHWTEDPNTPGELYPMKYDMEKGMIKNPSSTSPDDYVYMFEFKGDKLSIYLSLSEGETVEYICEKK
jgi:hypothetical protein